MKKIIILFIFCLFYSFEAYARNNIIVTGSTTLFPFASLFAEHFGKKFTYPTPIIESIGTSPGFKSFCSNNNTNSPDIVTASRKIKKSETTLCKMNNVGEVLEIKIGYDGIVIANSILSPRLSLSINDIFKILFAYSTEKADKLTKNNILKWNQASDLLPNSNITIYAPHKNTGTYDSILSLTVENPCLINKNIVTLIGDIEQRKKICSSVRQDAAFVEIGTNETMIVRKIQTDPNSMGIFGLVFLLQNKDKVHSCEINGVIPTIETITNRSYPLSRELYIYVKKENFATKDGLADFVYEIIKPSVIGVEGYLARIGLVSLQKEEIIEQQKRIRKNSAKFLSNKAKRLNN